MKRLTTLALFASLAILLAACSQGDPYADPGTPPPDPITDPTIATSGSISPKPGSSDLMEINVAGFLEPESEVTTAASEFRTLQRPRLRRDDFTVVEAGVVQGITVEEIGAGSEAKSDVVFVFDTTSSMGTGLTSVTTSILDFANTLDTTGLDVQLGAVTFGDAFDTQGTASGSPGTSIMGATPPTGFDSDERPSLPLTANLTDFEDFMEYEEDSTDGNGPRGGGDVPENALGALEFAYDEMQWRDGAQRHLIVVTDVCSHNSTTYGDANIEGDWIPGDFDSVLAKMNAVVHVVSPSDFTFTVGCGDGEDTTDMANFTGSSATGGVHVEWDGSSEFDLSETEITDAAGGWLVTFRGTRDGEPKDVRVVIDAGSDIRGEFTLEDLTY